MNQSRHFLLSLCLSLSLVHVQPALAEGEGKENLNPFRPRHVTARPPIGFVESIGALKIDGRLAKGQELLWGSELIQAPDNATARISLNAIGQASLHPSSLVRVTTVTSTTGNNIERPTLIASLVEGSVNVKLQAGAMAYLTSGPSSFIASEGGHFSAEMRAEGLSVNALSGTIAQLGQWTLTIPPPVLLAAERLGRMQELARPRKYIIKPYNLGVATEVRARSSRQIQVRVTDENDNPVTDLPVVFALKEGIGQLGANAVTNANGIATASFSANAVPSTSMYTASVPGTSSSFTGSITVVSAGFWTVPVLATIATIAATGVTVVVKQDEKEPVSKTLPAPVIRP